MVLPEPLHVAPGDRCHAADRQVARALHAAVALGVTCRAGTPVKNQGATANAGVGGVPVGVVPTPIKSV